MSDSVSTLRAFPKQWRSASASILVAVIGLTVALALSLPAIKTGVFNAMSTDDAMRLVEVRDLINGQGWFDLRQYRLDPPGVLMHWSRIIDLPLALLILLLKPVIGVHGAEVVTLVLWPLLLLAIAVSLVVAIAREMSDGVVAAQIGAAISAALAAPALVHYRPGAIDHHNAQIDLLLALILFTIQIEKSTLKAALAGLVASLSLAIGVEMLPPIAAISVTVAGLFIWRGAPIARQVAAFATAMAASSFLLALALLPLPELTSSVCDSLGGPLLLLTVGGGVGLAVVVGIDRYHSALWLRLTTATVMAIVLVSAFVFFFPGCLASPYAQVDPLVASLWLERVQETVSLPTMLKLGPEEVPGFYGFPLVALGVAAAILVRSKPLDRFRWVLCTVALAALFGLSTWELRSAAGASLLAAPMFAAGAVMIWPSLAFGRNLLILTFLVSPVAFASMRPVIKPLIEVFHTPEMAFLFELDRTRCQSLSDVASMRQLPKGQVMAPIDLGPAILAETSHEIFAAPYHRNNDGNLAMLQLMMAPLPMARQMLSDRHVDYVVTCRTDHDHDIIERAPEGLAAKLARGETPEFLEPIDLGPGAKISAWRPRLLTYH